MSLLWRGEWFDPQTRSGTLSETEFERLVVQQAPYLFPNHILVKYRLDVISDDYVRRPDFALIHREYKGGGSSRCELVDHSLEAHVLPQITAFGRLVGTGPRRLLCEDLAQPCHDYCVDAEGRASASLGHRQRVLRGMEQILRRTEHSWASSRSIAHSATASSSTIDAQTSMGPPKS